MIKNITQLFLEQAKKKKRKIGIVIMRPTPETIASLKQASNIADLVVIGSKVEGFNNIVEEDQDEAAKILITQLKENKVEGIVRGQAKDSYTFELFHKIYGKQKPPSNRKVCPCIMESPDGKISFVMTSASIYHDMTLEDKKYLADRTIQYMEEVLKLKPKIGIMSSRRPTGLVGQFSILEDFAKNSAGLAQHLKKKGYEVNEVYIELETAVAWGANYIIPTIGLLGNVIFRSLVYLGNWRLISCPYLDLGVVYEDGSRNETDFYNHIVHAAAMLNSDKK
ncbi:MAG: hypothetical protein V1838_00275 [Patescibacteria group bacterium]